MKKLSELKQGEEAIVSSVNGDTRYVGRITSIGIMPGCRGRNGGDHLMVLDRITVLCI